MLALIILIIFGLGTAYFATQNTGLVHIMFGNYLVQGIPLYIIVVGSILLGVFISWLVNIVDSFSSTRIIYGKDSALKKANKEIESLLVENQLLEKEITRLQKNENVVSEQSKEYGKAAKPSFVSRVRHSFG